MSSSAQSCAFELSDSHHVNRHDVFLYMEGTNLELLLSRSKQARCIPVTPLRVGTQQLLDPFKTSIMFIITIRVIFGMTQNISMHNTDHGYMLMTLKEQQEKDKTKMK